MWRINVRDLAGRFRISKDTVCKYLTELRRTGYCEMRRYKVPDGKFCAEYVIYEEPVLKNQPGSLSAGTSPRKSDVLNYSRINYRGGEDGNRNKHANDAVHKDEVSPSLLSDLTTIARKARIGSAFITPEWTAKVAALVCRDGLSAEEVRRAFEICLEIDPQYVRYFSDRMPKYVAIRNQRRESHKSSSGRRSAETTELHVQEKGVTEEELQAILAERATRGDRFAVEVLTQRRTSRQPQS